MISLTPLCIRCLVSPYWSSDIAVCSGRTFWPALKREAETPVGLDVQEIDITLAVQVDGVLREHKPQLVINCAALYRCGQGGSGTDLAFAVNRTGPENLAIGCKHLHSPHPPVDGLHLRTAKPRALTRRMTLPSAQCLWAEQVGRGSSPFEAFCRNI
jgi:hypothetical protein